MARTVGILYGWAEGPDMARRLHTSLKSAGFTTSKDVSGADIIIAHSGGVLFLPPKSKAQFVLLVGVPHWPGKHPIISSREKVRLELKEIQEPVFWARKTFANFWYTISRPRYLFTMWRRWQGDQLPGSVSGVTYLAIRNEQDTFMHPSAIESLAKEKGWKLRKLPGHHDDIWQNPEPYVALIRELLG